MYEIIGKLPLLRKRYGFYRNVANSNKLAFGAYYEKIAGFKVGLRRNAISEEEARRIAIEMLTSKERFESVAIQNSEHPELGAIELKVDKTDPNHRP